MIYALTLYLLLIQKNTKSIFIDLFVIRIKLYLLKFCLLFKIKYKYKHFYY